MARSYIFDRNYIKDPHFFFSLSVSMLAVVLDCLHPASVQPIFLAINAMHAVHKCRMLRGDLSCRRALRCEAHPFAFVVQALVPRRPSRSCAHGVAPPFTVGRLAGCLPLPPYPTLIYPYLPLFAPARYCYVSVRWRSCRCGTRRAPTARLSRASSWTTVLGTRTCPAASRSETERERDGGGKRAR